jgi:hypothetical protein
LSFPRSLVPQGFIAFNAQEAIPQLTVNYLLFEFGGRSAAVEARVTSIFGAKSAPRTRLHRFLTA